MLIGMLIGMVIYGGLMSIANGNKSGSIPSIITLVGEGMAFIALAALIGTLYA